jgi:predicted CoA-binding protein
VVQGENQSKNVIVFGLSEMKDENAEERVQEVLQEKGL